MIFYEAWNGVGCRTRGLVLLRPEYATQFKLLPPKSKLYSVFVFHVVEAGCVIFSGTGTGQIDLGPHFHLLAIANACLLALSSKNRRQIIVLISELYFILHKVFRGLCEALCFGNGVLHFGDAGIELVERTLISR